ncbi:MAG: winged helix-turn-helix transcriptional regulator [Armatimonadetes bacterium]|nr:winged helix-turn-helix transcriptional regulator [Armatimonadota bacterium]
MAVEKIEMVSDDVEDLSRAFRALGDATRLGIVTFLCQADKQGQGATVGEVSKAVTGVSKANPRISFHLKELRTAGLITVEKQGKFIICRPDWGRLATLGTFLTAITALSEAIAV